MAGCVAFAAWPVFVWAGNQVHPRTPVDWNEAPCVQVVERDVDPVLALGYGVAADDVDKTPDELSDSRTHQFLAFLEHHPPSEALPRYLSEGDLQRALDADLQQADQLAEHPVVDTHPVWQTRMVRITPDDARVPITQAQAASGVTWDTSALNEGAYFIHGYTWEPDKNLWSSRTGVVLVVDVLDENAPPAVAMRGGVGATDALARADEAFAVEACVHASAGATAIFEFRDVADDELPAGPWTQFDVQAVEGMVDLSADFVATSDQWGKGVDLRVRVSDGGGREALAYAPRVVQVINESPPGSDTGGETGDDPGPPDPPPSCRVDPQSRHFPLWSFFLVGIAGGRRRRSGRQFARQRSFAPNRATRGL